MNLMKDIRHHETRQYQWQFITQNLTISVVDWPRGIHNAIHRTVVLPATRLFNVGPWQKTRSVPLEARGGSPRRPVRGGQVWGSGPTCAQVLPSPTDWTSNHAKTSKRSCTSFPCWISWSCNWKLLRAQRSEDRTATLRKRFPQTTCNSERLEAFPQPKTHGLLVFTKLWYTEVISQMYLHVMSNWTMSHNTVIVITIHWCRFLSPSLCFFIVGLVGCFLTGEGRFSWWEHADLETLKPLESPSCEFRHHRIWSSHPIDLRM